MTQVGLAWMPSLCSMDTQRTSLRSPREPSALTRYLGTMKHEMPLVPGGAPGIRASTRWMMFSARSWSPKVMKIFWPVIRQVPSPSPEGTALVRSAPTSEPASGSVRFMVPVHSPVTIFSRYVACCSGVP